MAFANSNEVTTMPKGRVKWFNNAKGFGFILPEDESEDYFVHYSSIVMDGYKTLKAGQVVSFEMIDGPKGTHAVNVSVLDQEDDGRQHEDGNGNSAGASAASE
jgi:CspA family cold shock protein|tara:strand:+ start:1656 stop:1964 length:309 start_codon:yes stop_codon:yes gene_type:complete